MVNKSTFDYQSELTELFLANIVNKFGGSTSIFAKVIFNF